MQVQHQGLKVVIEELGGQVHLVAAGGAEFKPNQLDLGGGAEVRYTWSPLEALNSNPTSFTWGRDGG